MGFAAGALNILGVIFLSHAVYSAYEYSLLSSSSRTTSNSLLPRSLDPKINLPLDISLETLIAVLLLCVGVVLSSPALKPIQWNVWAGELERSKRAREVIDVGLGGGNPYANLEDRPGFLDIRAARKDMDAWAQLHGYVKK